MHTDSKKHETPTDANNVLAAGLSLIQAKDAAMIDGKKVRHRFFMDDEYFYFEGYSGSCYKCLKAAYGVRGTYITGVLNTIIEESGGKAKVVEEKEDWEDLEKFLNINLKVK